MNNNLIDELTTNFNRLAVLAEQVESNELNIKMANENRVPAPLANLDYKKLSELGNFIPIFDGQEESLAKFVSAVDDVINALGNERFSVLQWRFIIRVIEAKLTGPAKVLLNSRPELMTWDAIKNLFIQNFSDNKSIESWQYEINFISLKPGEKLLDYCNRITAIRAKIAQKLLILVSNENQRLCHLEAISSTLKSRLMAYLPRHILASIQAQRHQLITLDQVINEVIFLETEYEVYNQITPRQLPPKPIQKPINLPPRMNQQNWHPQRNPNYQFPRQYAAIPQAPPNPPPRPLFKPQITQQPPNIFPRKQSPVNKDWHKDPNKMSITSNRTYYQNESAIKNIQPKTGYIGLMEPQEDDQYNEGNYCGYVDTSYFEENAFTPQANLYCGKDFEELKLEENQPENFTQVASEIQNT